MSAVAPAKSKKKTGGATFEEALLRPASARVQANLEMLLGVPVAMSFDPGRVMDASAAASAAPAASTVVVGAVHGGGPELECVVCFERPLALVLAGLMQMLPEAAVRARLRELSSTDLQSEERASLGEAGNFVVAGMSEQLRELCGAKFRLVQAPTKYLSGPEAVRPDDCLASPSYMVASGTAKIGTYEEGRIVVFVPEAVAREAAPQSFRDAPTGDPGLGAAPSAAAAGRDGALSDAAAATHADGDADADSSPRRAEAKACEVLLVGTAGFAERFGALLPDGVTYGLAAGIGELCALVEGGLASRLVAAELPSGCEGSIELLGALRRHPGARGATFVVVLGRPTRQHVLRCAVTGLVDVLPPDAPDDLVRRRTAALIAAKVRAARA